MATCRVIQNLDGSVVVIHPAPNAKRSNETEDAFAARVFAETVQKNPSLQGRPFIDMLSTDLPPSRAARSKWRVAGNQVVPDLTVPNPPHPQQALLDEVERATTLADLKAALVKTIRGS